MSSTSIIHVKSVCPVILFPEHPASFAHNFVSGMQSFYFSESQDAMVLQTSLKIVFAVGLIDMGNSESQDS